LTISVSQFVNEAFGCGLTPKTCHSKCITSKIFSKLDFVSFQTSPELAKPGRKIMACFPFPVL
jgi:hypothetical protein